jgi:hypothetical protein
MTQDSRLSTAYSMCRRRFRLRLLALHRSTGSRSSRLFRLRLCFSVGSGLLPCRRASARRAAGPRKLLRRTAQSSFYRIPLNVSFDIRRLGIISNQPVITLILPKRSAAQIKHSRSRMPGIALQGPYPIRQRYQRSNQQMNVIRHDHKRMQIIPSKSSIAVENAVQDHAGNFDISQIGWSALSAIQYPIHSHKCLPRTHSSWWEDPISRQTAVKPKCNENPLTHNIPMWQPSLINPHHNISAEFRFFSHPRTRRAEARRQGGSPAPQSSIAATKTTGEERASAGGSACDTLSTQYSAENRCRLQRLSGLVVQRLIKASR